jgi:hypothetical protein
MDLGQAILCRLRGHALCGCAADAGQECKCRSNPEHQKFIQVKAWRKAVGRTMTGANCGWKPRVDYLIAVAHRRLRLRRLLVAIERNPQLLEDIDKIDIKRPLELAGMRARLGRAKKLEADIAVSGRRYDAVLGAIEDQHAALQGHVGQLENEKSQLDQVLGTMVAGSNGDPKRWFGLRERIKRRPRGSRLRPGH